MGVCPISIGLFKMLCKHLCFQSANKLIFLIACHLTLPQEPAIYDDIYKK